MPARSPASVCLTRPMSATCARSPAVEIVQHLSTELNITKPDTEILVVEPLCPTLPDELEGARGVRKVAFDEAVDADVLVMLVDHKVFRDVDASRLEGKTIVDTRGIWRR